MGAIRLGVDHELTLKLRDLTGIKVFIELGTFKGFTAEWAAQHFDTVITIEGYQPRYLKTKARLDGKFPNLIMLYGDTRNVLPNVLKELGEPAIWFVDSHWCGEGAHDCNGLECPIKEEIPLINAHPFASEHVLMVDDLRLFEAPPPMPHDPSQWPTLPELTRLLTAQPRSLYYKEDVLYALPRQLEHAVDSLFALSV